MNRYRIVCSPSQDAHHLRECETSSVEGGTRTPAGRSQQHKEQRYFWGRYRHMFDLRCSALESEAVEPKPLKYDLFLSNCSY